MVRKTTCVQQRILVAFVIACSPVTSASEKQHMEHHHHQVKTGLKHSTAEYTVPRMTLYNHHGQAVSLVKLLNTDKPVLLNFIYTSCTAICPPMSATFATVQKKLGNKAEQVRMVSISIDPEHDTPQVLTAYAQRFHAGKQWSFLTGTQEQSIAVQKAFDTYHGDKMNHAPLTLLRRNSHDAWIRYDGFASVARLVKEMRSALPQ